MFTNQPPLLTEVKSIKEWEQSWTGMQQKFIAYISNPELWLGLLLIVLKIALIYIVARVITKVAHRAVEQLIVARDKNPLKLDTRRTKTIGKLVGNIITYVVNFIMILMVLGQFHIDLGPLLAGAGVVGLAIGFGAQSLVKDVITGFFIIFEDQFAVGDVVQIGAYKGNVEEIGLRITRVRSWTGEIHIIPNGTIAQVTNFSIHNSLAVIDVPVSREADIAKTRKLLEDTIKKGYEENVDLVKEPQVLGIQNVGGSEITLRVTAECKPNTASSVTRKLNEQIRKAFGEEGIDIP
ncbi:small conductance mechanosensitive channel [Paenibacillus sp. UNCCL117]|uniref:mechanosensitive ion channel family protein n=1 Tax=unclassified Paenibacillus TaxID=185978 RepID=UPI0008913C4C|nr:MULTISPECIES: mechanosensitive ion channel family protein [unclassified Paenibacillus]SDD86700.1 small conductance mechanosensitive channel [Paenibacillus sp. cl123]SFW54103.1 small conductance mechanosensitive channel [Paenibacillus sp. UNCCL117]